jgi:hypothetical protein
MRKRIIPGIICLALFISVKAFGENEWKQIKDSNGVKVYKQSVEGSPFYNQMAVGFSDVPFEVAVEVAKDPEHYYEWYGMCKKLEVVTKRSAHDYDMYFILDVPIVKDRDLMVNVTANWDYAKGVCTVNINRMENTCCAKSGLIAMPRMTGKFEITRVSERRVKCVYTVYADLGGSLPAAVINLLSWKHPFDTGVGAMKQTWKQKYFDIAKQVHNKDFGVPPAEK